MAKVGFVSLGCPKNLVDAERILTELRLEGYDLTNRFEGADVVVVNTCGFIDEAKQESIDAIGEAMAENGRVIVTGCMGADENAIREVHPDVLAVTGPHQYEAVVNAIRAHSPSDKKHDPFVDLVPDTGIKLTPRHYSYLKISEGCNHSCTFCIIPDMRGKLVSRTVGDVLGEAERLVQAGTRELLVISQDTSAYGVDLRYRTGFWNGRPVKGNLHSLCDAMGELGAWVRLHYVYPYPHVDSLIPLMAEGRILPYLDIPFQHASPSVLRNMKRPAHTDNSLERIARWRDTCPDLAIRSTFITGFPGETDDDFEMLLDWLAEARLDRVGCFTYSPVEGARANGLPDPVPEAVREERRARLYALQAQISAEKLAARVGQVEDVIIDFVGEDGAIGRSRYDAPEIDGEVHLPGASHLQPGDIVRARITDSDENDLSAVMA